MCETVVQRRGGWRVSFRGMCACACVRVRVRMCMKIAGTRFLKSPGILEFVDVCMYHLCVRTYTCVRDVCGRCTFLVIGSGSLLCRESQRYSQVCVCVEAFVFWGVCT